MRSLSANQLDQVAQDADAQQIMEDLRKNPHPTALVQFYVERDGIDGRDSEHNKEAVDK